MGSGQGLVSPRSGVSQGKKNAAKSATAGTSEKAEKKPQKRTFKPKNNSASYRSHSDPQTVTPLAAQEA